MRWTPEQIAAATDGTLHGPDRSEVVGVTIDTRQLQPGQLFVAIRGGRDGHDFIPVAIEKGAGALLVDHLPVDTDRPVIRVPDTSAALLQVGSAARDRLSGPVVGITGSVGKTSTKDLMAAALMPSLRTVASEKSFNNELGVPLTLANAPESTEVTVLEMGSRGKGHISALGRIARPTIGVVTAVAAAHTETFGGLEAIAEAKGELVEILPLAGTAVLNADYDLVSAMAARTRAAVVRYSTVGRPTADVIAEDMTIDDELRPRFTVLSPWGTADVRLEARGAHQVGNALAAISVACICGVDVDSAAAALADARLSPWRMDVSRNTAGAVILNDAYNANPASMEAALRALASLPARRRLAVLGVMAELGDRTVTDHRGAAALASELGIEVIAVGTSDYGVESLTIAEAVDALGPLAAGDAVLVKGSRVAELEVLAQRLSSD
jgi:UDP-N-acetylmuramoyl-tripeptide--D-alanyl-D-alanine ligase